MHRADFKAPRPRDLENWLLSPVNRHQPDFSSLLAIRLVRYELAVFGSVVAIVIDAVQLQVVSVSGAFSPLEKRLELFPAWIVTDASPAIAMVGRDIRIVAALLHRLPRLPHSGVRLTVLI